MRKKIVFQILRSVSYGTFLHRIVNVLAILIFIFFCNWQALAVGTSFTYQGKLTNGSSPVNVPQDFQFKIFNADTSGTQIGSTITKNDVSVSNGLFVVELDFGSNVFTGYSRYLEISVRPGSSTGSYTLLTPRQKINPTPYSILSRSSEALKLPYDATIDSLTNPAFSITNTTGDYAIRGLATDTSVGINYGGYFEANRSGGRAVYGKTVGTYGVGVYGYSAGTDGVGVEGFSTGTNGIGVHGYSSMGPGVNAFSSDSNSIFIPNAGKAGIWIDLTGEDGLHVNSATSNCISVASAGWSGVYVNSSGYDAIRVQSAGEDGFRFLRVLRGTIFVLEVTLILTSGYLKLVKFNQMLDSIRLPLILPK